MERGYEYLAITDHSHYLREGRMEAQDREIDALNERLAPFRLLKGVEVEHPRRRDARRRRRGARRRATGCRLAPHELRQETRPSACSAAMENPHVDCIGHLTGRKIGKRVPAPRSTSSA